MTLMKPKILALVTVQALLLIPSVVAQGNGKNWRAMPAAVRVSYVEGYMDGLVTMSIYAPDVIRIVDGKTVVDEKAAAATTREHFPTTLTTSGVVDGLSRFYDEPANGNITLPHALRILAMKDNGKPEADVNSMIQAARSRDQQPEGR